MRARDPVGLAGASFDLIVVGGGIYGCTLALESARRGLRPLLIERDDFGQHTSANSFRILHGGLRYLQTLNLRRFFESVSERSWFLRAFPDHVRPFPFLMPLYGEGLRRPSILRMALRGNDVLSGYRNRGVRSDRVIPAGRILSPGEVRATYPGVPTQGLVAGGLWYDAVMAQPQRIIMEIVRWGESRGAVALNYLSGEEVRTAEGRVRGIMARDRVSGRLLEYDAPVVVNCCGPWVRDFSVRAARDVPGMFRRSLAINLFLDCSPDFEVGLGVSARRKRGRTFFLYPCGEGILAGTFHVSLSEAADRTDPSPAHIEAFVQALREAAPGLGVSMERVLHVQWGELPVAREGTLALSAREVIHDHGRSGGPEGLVSVSGVKFTVARRVAERVLGRLRRRSLIPDSATPSDSPPPPPSIPSLAEALELLEADAEAFDAVVRRIADTESVVHVDDLILRRTDWGAFGAPGAGLAARVDQALAGRSRGAVGKAGDGEGFPPDGREGSSDGGGPH